ncbi:MAG: CBS domain-containing protein [Bacteroidota bacterium]
MNAHTNLKLYDIASRAVLTVTPETPLEEAIARFATEHISSLVVVDNDQPVGIVTERDLVRLMCIGSADRRPVRAVMSAPLMTVPYDLDFSTAQVMMANCGIRHLVLVDEAGRMRGVASETDFRRHFGTDLLALIQSLKTVVDQGGKLIAPERSLSYALETMASYKLDHVIVGRDGRAEGILTERDVPALLARHVDPQAVTLGAVMTTPLTTIAIDASIDEAARCMEAGGLRHLVVLNAEGLFLGVLSQHSMLEKLGVALMGQSRAQLESRMSMVLEATGVGTWEFDNVHGNLVRSAALNGMMESPPGLGKESLEDLLVRIDPADRQHLLACFDEVVRGNAERFAVDCRVLGANGKTRWISSRGKVVERDPEGKPLWSAGVVIDISAQKASEEQLRRSEARFRGLMEKIPLAIGHVNAEEEIVFINSQFEQLFGYTPADVPNLAAWWQLAYPDADYRASARQSWNEAVRLAIAAGGTLNPLEYRVMCKDGKSRLIEISGIAMGEDFLAIFIDVTERRQQQALLEFSNAILQRISIETRLAVILDFIVRQIQSREPDILCSVLLLDESGQHLKTGAAPDLPKEYSQAVDGVVVGPLAGSCGTAVFRRAPVFAADIATDPCWTDYRELARVNGLAACWSSPIFSMAGQVLGTFAVYWKTPRPEVSPIARRYVEAATTLVAIAIETSRRDAELRSRIDELRRWQQATLGREGRVVELKREVNALLARLGEEPRYASVANHVGAL